MQRAIRVIVARRRLATDVIATLPPPRGINDADSKVVRSVIDLHAKGRVAVEYVRGDESNCKQDSHSMSASLILLNKQKTHLSNGSLTCVPHDDEFVRVTRVPSISITISLPSEVVIHL